MTQPVKPWYCPLVSLGVLAAVVAAAWWLNTIDLHVVVDYAAYAIALAVISVVATRSLDAVIAWRTEVAQWRKAERR